MPAAPHDRRSIAASLAALAAAASALTCCLPLLPLGLAAGSSAAGAALPVWRAYFLPAAVVLLGFAFWQSHRAAQCRRPPGALSRLLLWSSAFFVAMMLLAPDLIANLLAG